MTKRIEDYKSEIKSEIDKQQFENEINLQILEGGTGPVQKKKPPLPVNPLATLRKKRGKSSR